MSDPSASGEAFVVAVRVRPPNARELASEAHKEIVKIVDRNILCFDPRPDADDVFNHSARKRPRQIAQRYVDNSFVWC
jgi:ribosomal protein S20